MSKQVKIMGLIAMAAFIGLLFMAYEFSKPNENYLHSEINNQNYFDLNLKYNYHKGSVEGDNLKKSLEKALSDNLISQTEYKSITGHEAEIVVFEKPEEKEFYKDAKQKLVNAIKNSSAE